MMKKERVSSPFKKVLVVDDDKVTQIAVKYLFERAGYKVVIATNGYQAIALFNETFALVTMDYNMPEMNGIEATRQIRQKENDKKIRKHSYIIGLTANTENNRVNEGIKAGMNVVTEKPLSYELLQNILSKNILSQ